MVKRQGKDKALFFLCLPWFFLVAGGVDRPALRLSLRLGGIDFSGVSPAIAAGNFLNWHNDKN